MASTIQVGTPAGVRLVEFAPDVWRQRDVKIVVDGRTVASTPFPREGSPHEEIAFVIDGDSFVGVVQLANASGPMDSSGLRYDVFKNAMSLTDGSSLTSARFRAPPVGSGYPSSFRFIDALLRIVPAAAVPGIIIGVTRGADDLSTAGTVALVAVLLGAVLIGTFLSGQLWRQIRTNDQLRVPSRAALGFISVLSSYAVTGVAAFAIVGVMRDTELIGKSVCGQAQVAVEAQRGGEPPGGMVLLDDPGPDFTLVWQGPMTLAQSAWTRVDTETLPQLRAAGFESAYARQWIRDDGTTLGADIFVFATHKGAVEYHQAVTAYACRYSSEAFDVPGGGVGLRILYGSGDPVRDQVAWIDGTRRVLIAIGYQDDSSDHSEILAWVARARTSASPSP